MSLFLGHYYGTCIFRGDYFSMFLFLLKDLYNFLASWLNFLFFVQVTFLLSAVVFATLRRSLTHTRIALFIMVFRATASISCLLFSAAVWCLVHFG